MSMIGQVRELKGRHVLLITLLFFGTVFVANGAFIYYALDTFPGLSDEHPYIDGLRYNSMLADAAAQKARGWQVAVEATAPPANGPVALSIRVRDRAGRPVRGLSIDAVLRRPVDRRYDRPLRFAEAEPGIYRATAVVSQRGQWELALKARTESGVPYRLEERLWLK